MVESVAFHLGERFRNVLDERLHAFVVHGSAAGDDYIPGFSDLDIVAFTYGPLSVDDCLSLGAAIGTLDPTPFAYLQLSAVVDIDEPVTERPVLIPGAFEVLLGAEPADRFLHSEATLRQSGRAWLRALPGLIAQDSRDWAVATAAARPRMLRLAMTRLKPALRALLVEQGEPVFATWTAGYSALSQRWEVLSPGWGQRLHELMQSAPWTAPDDRSMRELFAVLVEIAAQAAGTNPR